MQCKFQPNTSTIIVYDVIRYTYLFKVYKTMHAFHISITLVSILFINTATVFIMLLYRTLYNIYFTYRKRMELYGFSIRGYQV